MWNFRYRDPPFNIQFNIQSQLFPDIQLQGAVSLS